MRKCRVMIVDDSVVARKIISDAITADPMVEVAATAANGKIAVGKLTSVVPDLIILDIEMPEMNGLETLSEIRRTHPRLPVIIFSSLSERGAVVTLEALSLGASDYACKPANNQSVEESVRRIRDQLMPKIRSLCGLPTEQAAPAVSPMRPPAGATLAPMRRENRIDIVTIGVSTGGPNALADLLPELPGSFPVPILIVQHMPPPFTRLLAERLNGRCSIKVVEGAPGEVVEPGRIYIAPGNYHMVVAREGTQVKLKMNQDPPENSCRPAVDVLFRSVAATYGPGTLGLVLTGMGQDGLRGCEHIRQAGGQVLAQDEASSVVWGMPGYVARAGLADRVLPLMQLGGEIIRRVGDGQAMRASHGGAGVAARL